MRLRRKRYKKKKIWQTHLLKHFNGVCLFYLSVLSAYVREACQKRAGGYASKIWRNWTQDVTICFNFWRNSFLFVRHCCRCFVYLFFFTGVGLVTFPSRCISETVLEARGGASQEIVGGCGRSLSCDWQLWLRYSKINVVWGVGRKDIVPWIWKKKTSIFVFVRGTTDTVSYAFFSSIKRESSWEHHGRVMLGERREDTIWY